MIETRRLILSDFSENDAEHFYILIRNEPIELTHPYLITRTIKEIKDIISSTFAHSDYQNSFYYLIHHKDPDYLLGAIFANRLDSGELDISFFSKKSWNHNGYMSEALSAFIDSLPKGTIISFTVSESNERGLQFINKFEKNKSLLKRDVKYIPEISSKFFTYTL